MDELPKNIAAIPASAPTAAPIPGLPGVRTPLRTPFRRPLGGYGDRSITQNENPPETEPSPVPQPLPASRPGEKERICRRAVRGLGKRAGGFVMQEVKSTYEVDDHGNRTLKSQVVTRKQNPPDLAAIIFTLTNLEGGQWQARPDGAGHITGEEVADRAGGELSAIPEDLLRAVLKYFPAANGAGVAPQQAPEDGGGRFEHSRNGRRPIRTATRQIG